MSTFTITCAATTARLDASRKAQVTFTATNTLNQPLNGRARVDAADGAKPDWFSIVGDAERPFAAGGTQQYTVQIKVPETAPAGRYTFRLKMVGVPNPDELFGDGPPVGFEVPKPAQRATPIPWLWIAIAAVALVVLVGGGFAAFKLLNGSNPDQCKAGFVWRLAGPTDHVCVTPATAQQVIADNALAASRRNPSGGPYGPDTCLVPYVWRDAFTNDHVCVTGATRDQAAYDNSQAQARKLSP